MKFKNYIHRIKYLATDTSVYHTGKPNFTRNLSPKTRTFRSYMKIRQTYCTQRQFIVVNSSVASLTIKSRYANLKLLSLFISLEIDSFHSQ